MSKFQSKKNFGRGGHSKSLPQNDDESSGYSSFEEDDDENEGSNDGSDDNDASDNESGSDSDASESHGRRNSDSGSDNDSEDDEKPEVISSKGTQPSKVQQQSKTNRPIQPIKTNPNVPLYRLLAKQKEAVATEGDVHDMRQSKKRKLSASARHELYDKNRSDDEQGDEDSDDEGNGPSKKKKHAPAEMRSDKPVRRLRVDGNHQQSKFSDPRFLDYTGDLNHKHYSKNFEFLDEMRENEVKLLTKKMRKAKGGKKEKMHAELNVLKQQLNERKLGKKVMERIETLKQEDREKIKQGVKQNPYFLKNSMKKRLYAEEKFSQLKSTGKVDRYIQKKERQHQASINQSIPQRRNIDD